MGYSYLKLLHIIAVIIFLGNIFAGLFWIHIAVKTKDQKLINYTVKGLIKSDKYFTVPSVIIITIGGIISAIYGRFPILVTGWIFWSIILFSISGIIFGFRVSPLQKRMSIITDNNVNSNHFDWIIFRRIYSEWHFWAVIALLTPIAALVMMVLKVPE